MSAIVESRKSRSDELIGEQTGWRAEFRELLPEFSLPKSLWGIFIAAFVLTADSELGYRDGYVPALPFITWALVIGFFAFASYGYATVKTAMGIWRKENAFYKVHNTWSGDSSRHKYRRYGKFVYDEDRKEHKMFIRCVDVKTHFWKREPLLTVWCEYSEDQLTRTPYCSMVEEWTFIQGWFWAYTLECVLMQVTDPEDSTLRRRPPPDWAAKVWKTMAWATCWLVIGTIFLLVWWRNERRNPAEYEGQAEYRMVYYLDESREEQVTYVTYADLTINPATHAKIQASETQLIPANISEFKRLMSEDTKKLTIIGTQTGTANGHPLTTTRYFNTAWASMGAANSTTMMAQGIMQQLIDSRYEESQLALRLSIMTRDLARALHLTTQEYKELHETIAQLNELARIKIKDVWKRAFHQETEAGFFAAMYAWMGPTEVSSRLPVLRMQINGLQQAGLPVPTWLKDEIDQYRRSIFADARKLVKKDKRAPQAPQEKKSRWPFSRRKKDTQVEVSVEEQYVDLEEVG